MNWSKIVNIARAVKTSVDKKQKLPTSAQTVGKGEYGYLLSRGVIYYGNSIKTVTVKEAPKPSGDSIDETYKKGQYVAIATDVNKFISARGRLPNYDEYKGKKINIDLCIYCFAKIILFYNDNNRLPNTCEFDSSVFSSNSSKYSTKGGKICKKLMNIAKMNINSYNDVYNAMKKFSYEYYNDDVKPQSKTLSDKAGNCVDLNQIAYEALKELYANDKVQIVRGVVKCSNGKEYGHVWCRLKIKGEWTHFDASAAAKGIARGKLICSKLVSITDKNPSWAVSDDGQT